MKEENLTPLCDLLTLGPTATAPSLGNPTSAITPSASPLRASRSRSTAILATRSKSPLLAASSSLCGREMEPGEPRVSLVLSRKSAAQQGGVSMARSVALQQSLFRQIPLGVMSSLLFGESSRAEADEARFPVGVPARSRITLRCLSLLMVLRSARCFSHANPVPAVKPHTHS